MEKDLCRGVVYFTVLCDHPCLVSLLFVVVVSLHPVTFSNVFHYFCEIVVSTVNYANITCTLPMVLYNTLCITVVTWLQKSNQM